MYIIEEGTLTAQRYVREVFDVYVRQYAGAVGQYFILKDDNPRPHRAGVTYEYIEAETVVRVDYREVSRPQPHRKCLEHA